MSIRSERVYGTLKTQNKKAAKKALWLILTLAMIFIIIMIRIAFAGNNNTDTSFDSMPSNSDAYAIAKQFMLPDLKGNNIHFMDDGYQYSKIEDSVYVIRSFVEMKDNTGNQKKVYFKITLKYKGGSTARIDNWKVITLDED